MKKVDLISDATYWRNNELFKAQFKIPLLVKLSFLQVRNYDLVNNHRKYVSRESIPGLIVKQQQSSRIFLYVSLVDCIAYLNPWALFENVRRGFKRFRAWNTGGGEGEGDEVKLWRAAVRSRFESRELSGSRNRSEKLSWEYIWSQRQTAMYQRINRRTKIQECWICK